MSPFASKIIVSPRIVEFMSVSPNTILVSAIFAIAVSFVLPLVSFTKIPPTLPSKKFCASIVPLALISPEAVILPVNTCVSSTESPNVVEPDKVAIDILVTDEETTYSLAINEPEIFTLFPQMLGEVYYLFRQLN